MKTRTYMIGAALILLAIIIGGFYLNEKHDYKNSYGSVAQTIPSETESSTTADNSVQGSINADNNTDNNNVATVTNSNHPRNHFKRNKLYAQANDIQANDINEYSGAIVSNDANSVNGNVDNEIVAENPKTYFGNKPVITKRIKTSIPPRNRFTLPDNIGLELGYNQSSLSHNNTSNVATGNFVGGLLVNFNLGDHFAIQPGVRYINRGNKLDNGDLDTRERLSLHYLEVPANLVWKIGAVGDARIMVGAGPYVSYLLGAKDKYQSPGFSDGSDVIAPPPQYNTSNINRFDYGMGGFIGCQSPDGLFAKAGGELGMKNIMQNADGSTSNRNASILITVGYIIGGK